MLLKRRSRDAQCELAEMYEEGRGVSTDMEQACAWLGLAAEQGDDRARWALKTYWGIDGDG